MEMLQVMLNYPQIFTDMVFENVCTLPIEQRAGIEYTGDRNDRNGKCNDGDEVMSFSYKIRKEKSFSRMETTHGFRITTFAMGL